MVNLFRLGFVRGRFANSWYRIDVFRTNRKDNSISDVSSYLDLAPLYGSSQEEQNSIRTFKDGLILPDTFAEKRLLGLPPGICVLLVMYSRFHNYAATTLKAINEEGRFSLPSNPDEAALKKQDNDLFQVARLWVAVTRTRLWLTPVLDLKH